jgi:hypothetical protein
MAPDHAGVVTGEAPHDTQEEVTVISCPDCRVPAKITERFSLPSTDGPVDHIVLRCAVGHHFRMPTDGLPAQQQEQLSAPGIRGKAAREGERPRRGGHARSPVSVGFGRSS